MRDYVLLFVNGRPHRVGGEDVFLSLSDYLRRRLRLTGTKVVCAEGDCGSCSAFLGRVVGGKIYYTPVCSCIQIVLQLDGVHVVTVEGLKDGEKLNPIQEAMVAGHGAQCGFCTPGFIVSMYEVMRDGKPVTGETVTRGLVGNLCRCTGYDSIVKSALAADRSAIKSLDEMYPPGGILEAIGKAVGEEVLVEVRSPKSEIRNGPHPIPPPEYRERAPSRKFFKPVTLSAATKFRAENPDCTVIAGATDLGVVYNKRMRELDVVLSLNALEEMRGIRVENGVLHVGARATLTELELACLEHLPELGKFLAWFGSPLIKNAGTIGGNLVTGSPIGDTLPPLVVLEAEIEVAGVAGSRVIPIGEFYTGYRKTALRPDELLTGVRIPLLKSGEVFKLYKVSRRKDLDISTFGAAIWLRREVGRIVDVRIAYGGVGPMVLRMRKTEDVLRGAAATLENFERAAELARDEVTPITDVRGSQEYRRRLAGNILLKFWYETMAGGDNGDGNGQAPRAPTRRSRGVAEAPHPA